MGTSDADRLDRRGHSDHTPRADLTAIVFNDFDPLWRSKAKARLREWLIDDHLSKDDLVSVPNTVGQNADPDASSFGLSEELEALVVSTRMCLRSELKIEQTGVPLERLPKRWVKVISEAPLTTEEAQ